MEALKKRLKDLENKTVVVHSVNTCLARLENVRLDEDLFMAEVKPLRQILNNTGEDMLFSKFKDGFEIGARLHIIYERENNMLTCGGSWRLWDDPETVRKVEELLDQEEHEEAMLLTHWYSFIDYDKNRD